MSKTLLIAVAVVVVVGVGAWYLGYMPSAPSTEVGIPNENGESDSPKKITGSLEDLMAAGEPYRCTFSYKSDLANSDGTVYIAQDKMRGDFKTTVKTLGSSVETHLIRDSAYTYTWIADTGAGVKIPTESATVNSNTSFDPLSQELEYECVKWTPDATVFALPSDVSFSDAPQL